MSLHTTIVIDESFPLFDKWPSEKLSFLEHMSCDLEEYKFEVTDNEDDIPHVRNFVVVRDEFRDGDDPLLHCPLCSERLILLYEEDEDEWVYEDTKEFMCLPYHYPLCYEYAKSNFEDL